MAQSVCEENVWKKYSLKKTDDVIEVREKRLIEIFAAAGVVLLIPCVLAFIFYMEFGYFGLIQFLICLFGLGLGIYAFATAMNMPRAIRFFPAENVIEQSCTFGLIRWHRRWTDLSGTGLRVCEVEYETRFPPPDTHPEPELDSDSFTWKKHFDDLLEILLPIRSTAELVRGNQCKVAVKAFGLFTDPDRASLLVVTTERQGLDCLVSAWLATAVSVENSHVSHQSS